MAAVVVPNVVGKKLSDAIDTLEAEGLTLKVVSGCHEPIQQQKPKAGDNAQTGDYVGVILINR